MSNIASVAPSQNPSLKLSIIVLDANAAALAVGDPVGIGRAMMAARLLAGDFRAALPALVVMVSVVVEPASRASPGPNDTRAPPQISQAAEAALMADPNDVNSAESPQ